MYLVKNLDSVWIYSRCLDILLIGVSSKVEVKQAKKLARFSFVFWLKDSMLGAVFLNWGRAFTLSSPIPIWTFLETPTRPEGLGLVDGSEGVGGL